jgi:hypothetical protein
LEMNLFSPTSFGNWCYVPPIMTPRAWYICLEAVLYS